MEEKNLLAWTRLTDCRAMRGLSQQELAERTGIDAGNISNYESGNRKPSVDNLEKLADALAVSTDCLLDMAPLPDPIRLYDVEFALDFINDTHEQNIERQITLIKKFINQQRLFPKGIGTY